jgi:hypothetical protein
MKKLLFILACALSYNAQADIIVKGKGKGTQDGNGNTVIICKGSRGECIRISSSESRTSGSQIASIGTTLITYTSYTISSVYYDTEGVLTTDITFIK